MSFENFIRNINYISWNWYGDYIYIFSFININCFSLTEQFNSIKNSKWLNRLLARMFSRRARTTARWNRKVTYQEKAIDEKKQQTLQNLHRVPKLFNQPRYSFDSIDKIHLSCTKVGGY